MSAFTVWLALGNAAATWALVGLIWTIQVVHYPLFAAVGAEQFVAYERSHQSRITLIVAPLMGIELVTAALLIAYPPSGVASWTLWLGAALVGAVWLSTALIQVPQHELLGRGLDPRAVNMLVATNWIRTIAWTARGGIMLWVLARMLAK